MRTVGIIVLWFALGLGATELMVLSMEQVVVSSRTTQQIMAYAPPALHSVGGEIMARSPFRR